MEEKRENAVDSEDFEKQELKDKELSLKEEKEKYEKGLA